MTLIITIPIFEIFWSLPPDIRVFLFLVLVGGLMFLICQNQPGNPLYLGGILFLIVGVAFLIYYLFLITIANLPPFPSNLALPISFEVK